MSGNRSLRRPTAVSFAIAAAACLTALSGSAAPAALNRTSGSALPDLYQRAPAAISAVGVRDRGAPRFRLGFDSAVDNVGGGPLVVVGRRATRAAATMTVDQVIDTQSDVPLARRIGYMKYALGNHDHWHLLPFERYELRRYRDFTLVGRDRKVGFCLGDRYPSPLVAPAGTPFFVDDRGLCGTDHPEALEVREGISPGYGDIYFAQQDGQYVDVTGLGGGRYWLVHRVNAGRVLREASYANDVSAALVSLSWPHGHGESPVVVTLRTCEGRARCAEG